MRLAFELVDWVKQMAPTSTCEHHPICWGQDGNKRQRRVNLLFSEQGWPLSPTLGHRCSWLLGLWLWSSLCHWPPDSQAFNRHCWLSWFSRLHNVGHGTSWPPFSRQFPVLSINSLLLQRVQYTHPYPAFHHMLPLLSLEFTVSFLQRIIPEDKFSFSWFWLYWTGIMLCLIFWDLLSHFHLCW